MKHLYEYCIFDWTSCLSACFFSVCHCSVSYPFSPSSWALILASIRDLLHGPWPLTTLQKFIPVDVPKIIVLSFFHFISVRRIRNFNTQYFGLWNSHINKSLSEIIVAHSFIFHFMDCAECGDSLSFGRTSLMMAYHHLLTESWTICRWVSEFLHMVSNISYPCLWWNDSSLHILTIARIRAIGSSTQCNFDSWWRHHLQPSYSANIRPR